MTPKKLSDCLLFIGSVSEKNIVSMFARRNGDHIVICIETVDDDFVTFDFYGDKVTEYNDKTGQTIAHKKGEQRG